VWTCECEEVFSRLKEYLVSPSVLCKPWPGTPIRLYFAVTDRAISSVIMQEQDRVQKPVYFVSKGAARARNMVPSHRECRFGGGIHSSAALPLFSEFCCDSND